MRTIRFGTAVKSAVRVDKITSSARLCSAPGTIVKGFSVPPRIALP